jgi:hypothetical protein
MDGNDTSQRLAGRDADGVAAVPPCPRNCVKYTTAATKMRNASRTSVVFVLIVNQRWVASGEW